jgi:hypothetical protein
MHFSCLSRLPEGKLGTKTVFASASDYLGTEAVVGRFGEETVDLFSAYYAARRDGEQGPHYEFANTPATEGGILAFTARWGVIGRTGPVNPHPFFSEARKRHNYESDQNLFEIALDYWISVQERFRTMIDLTTSRRRADKLKLLELINIRQDFGTFDLILPKMDLSKDPSRRTREEYLALSLTVQSNCLWEAFCLMVWEDLGQAGVRIQYCADPNCHRVFSTDRPGKVFCDSNCAHRYHKRMWGRRNLPTWRARKKGDSDR